MGITRLHNGDDAITQLRQEMVDRLKNLGLIRSPTVEEALRVMPRHLFVPHVESKTAYNDIPIMTRLQDGQAISSSSAPSVMAIMLEMLDLHPGQRILEIGAGTGYNAALMAYIVGENGRVVTIDIDDDIVQDARAHLLEAGIENVQVVCGDGGLGWAEGAPYDRVILTASSTDIPLAWHKQLRPGGRLVLPLQLLTFRSKLAEPPQLSDQLLLAFEWTGDHFESFAACPCGFMALRGNFAQEMRKTGAIEPESGCSANIPGDIDEQSIFQFLRGPAQDEATAVHLAFHEMFGLRLWLGLREPSFCEIYVPENANVGTIPAQLQRDATFSAAIGLGGQASCCLLKLEEERDDRLENSKYPFKLLIRRFGEDQALTERLREQVEIWDQAGHPFVWALAGMGNGMQNLHVRAFPVEAPYGYVPHRYETVLTRPHTCFIFAPQSVPPVYNS